MIVSVRSHLEREARRRLRRQIQQRLVARQLAAAVATSDPNKRLGDDALASPGRYAVAEVRFPPWLGSRLTRPWQIGYVNVQRSAGTASPQHGYLLALQMPHKARESFDCWLKTLGS
jgi:hypothetical protein